MQLKGGQQVTLLAINLAIAATLARKVVVIIDLTRSRARRAGRACASAMSRLFSLATVPTSQTW
jgi:hypothetical protein